ncbi:MAG: hypothetical protein IJR04_02460 [Bacteroidales bacterium]|nr:hypothetical protein [Bacteroidales bacterium]
MEFEEQPHGQYLIKNGVINKEFIDWFNQKMALLKAEYWIYKNGVIK